MTEFTIIIAFFAGIASFLSPCILPLIPAYLTFLAGTTTKELQENAPRVRITIFLSSVFFVLGFSLVFSILGVLLQSVLSSIAFDLRNTLSQIGGIIIILFGLFLLGVIKIPQLQGDKKLTVKKTRFQYLSSFLFGAAFAVGWTPCVGPVLGAVLTLAATQPEAAFPLMLSYSLGLGIPFLLVGAFTSKASGFIQKFSKHLKWFNIVFGIILIILGILVFTNTLVLVANLGFVNQMLLG